MDQGPIVYGKYQLVELIARGGMAEVYKAKSYGVEGFEKILVIKRILADLEESPEFVDMFINEAKIAVSLSHANIVQVFDLGRADDAYFIAMEYVAGPDLSTVQRRARRHGKALPLELAVFIASEVAKALDYAHRRRGPDGRPLHIVHRDVSPQNVLVSHEGEVKLTDFGIAKARTTIRERTQTGVLKGKYVYMSPEQAQARPVDGKTDVFALGTVLYEMLAGKNPFQADTTQETLRRVRDAVAPPLHTVAPHVPEELSAIVARAMARTPEQRHPNAGLFYEDLVQFLFAVGRRVGAHDLAAFLDDLRDASELARVGHQEASLRATFDLLPRRTPGPTPVAAPRREPLEPGTTGGKKRAGTDIGERASPTTTTGVARPQSERRDATVLAIRMPAAAHVPDVLTAQVQRWGGQVLDLRVVGSGVTAWTSITALFGLSDPDGRDTEAAARCAIAIRKRLGVDAPMAIVASRVMVDLDGNLVKEKRFERLLADAQKLLTETPIGTTLLPEGTERLLRRQFDLRPAPGGQGRHRLVDARDFTESLGRFVGRRDELRRLGEILAEANRGQQRVLAILGEPGSGKSRLLLEMTRRLRIAGHDVGMHVARIDRHAKNIPLSAAQEMLRVLLGIDEFDPEAEMRRKVQRLRELGLSRSDSAAVELALGLSLEGGPLPAGERSLRSAIAKIATKLAEDRLTVFAFDGIDGADEASLYMLDKLVRDARGVRIVIVVTARPDASPIQRDVPGYEEMNLGPLEDSDVARLTAALLGADEVPMELLSHVATKSGGNPLHVEEYVLALRDAGVARVDPNGQVVFDAKAAGIELPKTLRGIVAARLARLGPLDRQLLQIAATIGTSFRPELLAHVSAEDPSEVDVSVAHLERRGILMRVAHGELAFTHELIAMVTREGLTPEARAELHGAVAGALERLHPERLEEWADRLAMHHREAGRRELATRYHVRAADRLAAEQRFGPAVDELVRAVELLGTMGEREERIALYRRIGDLSLRGRLLADGPRHMQMAMELADASGREALKAEFATRRGQLLCMRNESTEGLRFLDQARRIARRLADPELLRDVTVACAEGTARTGDFGTAVGLLDEALELARRTGDRHAIVRCLLPLAVAHASAGHSDFAARTLDEARGISRALGLPMLACEIELAELEIRYYVGAPEVAMEAGARALEIAKEHGFAYEATLAAQLIGECYLRVGDYKRSFAMLRYAFDVAREHGFARQKHKSLAMLGCLDAVKFGSEEGRDRLVEAARYAREHGHYGDLVQLKYLSAYIDQAHGQRERAVLGFRDVVRLANEYGHGHYARAAESALAAIHQGRPVRLPR